MGQKISPLGLRLGINQKWRSRWVSSKANLSLWIKEDLLIRRTLKSELNDVFVAKVEIERQGDQISIFLWTSRIGIIVGQKGKNIERVVLAIKKTLGKRHYLIKIDVVEVKNPALDAQLIANDVAYRIANKENYRITQKQVIKNAVRLGVKGIKISVAGRLNGADIARREHISEGKIPLSTLRAHIDYGFAPSYTSYGKIGVKVWIYHGDIINQSKENDFLFQNIN